MIIQALLLSTFADSLGVSSAAYIYFPYLYLKKDLLKPKSS